MRVHSMRARRFKHQVVVSFPFNFQIYQLVMDTKGNYNRELHTVITSPWNAG